MRTFARESKFNADKRQSRLRTYLWDVNERVYDYKLAHKYSITIEEFEKTIDDIIDICTDRGRF